MRLQLSQILLVFSEKQQTKEPIAENVFLEQSTDTNREDKYRRISYDANVMNTFSTRSAMPPPKSPLNGSTFMTPDVEEVSGELLKLSRSWWVNL